MTLRYLMISAVCISISALTGCGGGKAPTVTSVTAQPSAMTVKLSSVAKSGENPQIKGVSVTLLLPDGVTLKTVEASKQTAAGVVRYSGAPPFANLTSQMLPRPLFGSYSSAGASGRNSVTISFFGLTPFTAGEFATVTCDVAGGTTVSESAFQITGFHATGDSSSNFADDLTPLFETPLVTTVR